MVIISSRNKNLKIRQQFSFLKTSIHFFYRETDMTKKPLFLILLAVVGCSGKQINPDRKLAESTSQIRLSEVVRKSAASSQFCPSAREGETCLMTWTQAIEFCRNQKAHLPTAREYANLVKSRGTQILEVSAQATPPAGFYLVDCQNPGGNHDSFYMNHSQYKRSNSESVGHLLWTASFPPQHPQYAHVYYDEWGGGGGKPQDHLMTVQNSVQCIGDE